MWREWMIMARDSLAGAETCLTAKCARSAVSRAYYAVFAAVTAMLLKCGQHPRAAHGAWPHKELPKLVRRHLSSEYGAGRARDLSRIVNVNYMLRILADYGPGRVVDGASARRCVANARAVLKVAESLL